MKRIAKFVAPMIAVALALAFSQVIRAEDAAATGSVSVMVKDKDGKAVEGATVRLTVSKPAANSDTAAKSEPKLADDAKAPAPAPSSGRPTPIAEGKTDKDGKCTLEKIPAGEYNLSSNLKGTGNARKKVSVKAGETLSVELSLKPRETTPAPAK